MTLSFSFLHQASDLDFWTTLPVSFSSFSISFHEGILLSRICKCLIQAWSVLREGPRQTHLPSFSAFFHSKVPLRSYLLIPSCWFSLEPSPVKLLSSPFQQTKTTLVQSPMTFMLPNPIVDFDSSFFLCTRNC